MNISKPFREDFTQTQGFGVNPDAYARFGLKGHNGLDFACPTGTTIIACDDGTIVRIYDDPTGYGHYIKIQHTWGESIYAHLQNHLVTVGSPVKRGQAIGISDNTGNSTGPHLHFGVRIYPYNTNDGWSGYSDPTPYFSAPQGGVEPVSIRDKFKLIFSVLHSKPEELVTEADIDQAEGSQLDPYTYGTQDLNNRIIQPILDQVTILTDKVKELESQLKEANDKISALENNQSNTGVDNPLPTQEPAGGTTPIPNPDSVSDWFGIWDGIVKNIHRLLNYLRGR